MIIAVRNTRLLISLKEEIDKIVILDDNDDRISNLFEEEFILVNCFFGLNLVIENIQTSRENC